MQRQAQPDGHAFPQTDAPGPVSLDDIAAPAPAANVTLASGRRYELTAGAEADRVTIRARTGEIVLRIEVTDAGPVLSFSGASVELVAARSLRLAAEQVTIDAGSLRERVAGDHHVRVGGDERIEAARVQLQANEGDVGVRAMGRIALDGEHIGLNDDPLPRPFAWSAVAADLGTASRELPDGHAAESAPPPSPGEGAPTEGAPRAGYFDPAPERDSVDVEIVPPTSASSRAAPSIGPAPFARCTAFELPAGLRERMAKLPFREGPPESTAPATEPTGPLPATLASAEVASAAAATTARRNVGAALAKTFARTLPAAADLAAQARAALPFARTSLAVEVSVPVMPLEGYASLCAELAVAPEQAAEILKRYHVPDEATRRALDEHWRARLATRPEARAAFDTAVTTYKEWLLGQRR